MLKTRFKHALRTTTVAAVLLMATALPVRDAQQVLPKVPPEAILVVRVANLQQTSQKLAKFAQQLGVAMFIPGAADPLGTAKLQSSMTKGINDAGELGIVLLDPEQGAPDDGLIILVPISNFNEFVTNFQNVTPKGAMMAFDNNGEKGFIANWGTHAAVTKFEENVAKAPAGLNVAGPAGKQLTDNDIVLYFDVRKVRVRATGLLAEARVQISRSLQAASAQQPNSPNSAMMPFANIMMTQMINAIDTTIQQTDMGTMGLTIQDDGLLGTSLAQTAPGSQLNQIVTSIKPANGTTLKGLGDGKYLMFGGLLLDPAVTIKAMDLFTGNMKEDLAKDPSGAEVQKILDSARKSFGATNAMTFGVVAPSGPLGQSSLFQFVGTSSGDAQVIMDATRDNFQAQITMMNKMLPADQVEKMGMTYKPAAKTVDGVAFDEFTSKMVGGGATPQEQQVAQIMTMFYGPQGMRTWIGKADDNSVVTVIGDEALIPSAIAAARADAAPLSNHAGVKTVSAKLPANRFGELYIPLDVTISTASNYAKQMGVPMNVVLPPDLPPIGMALTSEEGSIRATGYVPTQLLQSLISAGMQGYMQMQQQPPAQPAQPEQPPSAL